MADEVDVKDERGFLRWLDSPRLAIYALVIFVLILSLFSLKLWSDQQKQVNLIDSLLAQRLEEAKAADRDAVGRCYSNATQGPAIRRVLDALEREARTRAARSALQEYKRLNLLNVPTVRECRELANKLNVKIPRSVQ